MKRVLSWTMVAALGMTMSGVGLSGWMEGTERDAAMDLEPDMENGMDVYEVCAACHLPEGWGLDDGTFA